MTSSVSFCDRKNWQQEQTDVQMRKRIILFSFCINLIQLAYYEWAYIHHQSFLHKTLSPCIVILTKVETPCCLVLAGISIAQSAVSGVSQAGLKTMSILTVGQDNLRRHSLFKAEWGDWNEEIPNKQTFDHCQRGIPFLTVLKAHLHKTSLPVLPSHRTILPIDSSNKRKNLK